MYSVCLFCRLRNWKYMLFYQYLNIVMFCNGLHMSVGPDICGMHSCKHRKIIFSRSFMCIYSGLKFDKHVNKKKLSTSYSPQAFVINGQIIIKINTLWSSTSSWYLHNYWRGWIETSYTCSLWLSNMFGTSPITFIGFFLHNYVPFST
jgi:hypothetical protein